MLGEAVRDELGLPPDAPDYEVKCAISAREFLASVKAYEDGLKMRWTAELLGSAFALGDGSIVTWGEATERDHYERMAMFVDTSANAIEGAARHKAAIAAIRESRVTCLNDLPVESREAVAV
jgi:hypothetical protein